MYKYKSKVNFVSNRLIMSKAKRGGVITDIYKVELLKEKWRKNMKGYKKETISLSKVFFAVLMIVTMCLNTIVPISVEAAGQSIDVTIDSDYENYQTFTSLIDGTVPPQLSIKISVNVQDDGGVVNGGKIIIPLNYAPKDDTKYANFDYTPNHNPTRNQVQIENFFEYDSAKTLAELGIAGVTDFVENIAVVGGNLEITLKDGLSGGMRQFYLYFNFNNGYAAKIPAGTTLWEIKAKTYIGVTESTPVPVASVTSGAVVDGVSIGHTVMTPSAVEGGKIRYESGDITLRVHFRNGYDYQTVIDTSQDIYLYMDIPSDLVLTDATSYFSIISGVGTAAAGYTRYAYKLTSATDWRQYHYQGNANSTFSMFDFQFEVPTTVMLGDEINITTGIVIKKVNGNVQDVSRTTTYVKVNPLPWNLYIANQHRAGDNPPVVRADGTGSEFVSTVYVFGYGSYGHLQTSKNQGSTDATGVKWVLEQPASGSAKVAFRSITVLPSRESASINEMKYNVSLEIVDTKGTVSTSDDTTRTYVYGGIGSPTVFTGEQSLNLTGVGLSSTEYIKQVIVVPRGNGVTPSAEGTWPYGTGIAIGYVANKWNSGTWPDGSPIADYTSVATRHYMEYDNNNNPLDHIVTGYRDSLQPVSYIKDGTSAVRAVLVANDTSVAPGSIADFEIVGYANRSYSSYGWNNPKIMIRVPNEMELIGNTFTLRDVNGITTVGVNGSLVTSDANYKYYSFDTTGEYTSGTSVSGMVFSISVKFKIAEGTPAGVLDISRVLVSKVDSANFKQAYYATGNLPGGESAANYGLNAGDKYSVSTGTTMLLVQTLSNITSTSSIKVDGVHANFIPLNQGDVFPAANNGNVQIKLTLTNEGNTTFKDLKIYNLLPAGFAASDGNIEFEGIDGSTVTAYYTDATPPTLAEMEPDTYNPAANPTMWKTSLGAVTDPTAMFLLLNSEIAPGSVVEIVMNFKIPATGDQTAYNQFEFSAAEKTQGSVIKKQSGMVGFSTKAISIVYEGNIAEVNYVNSGDVVENLPLLETGIYQIDTLTVATATPTLYGYDFDGWNTKADGTGTTVVAGTNASYTATERELTLYAQWKAKDVSVSYNVDGTLYTTKTYKYGTTLASTDLPTTPTKTGYMFNGWGSASTGTVVDHGIASVINSTTAKTVYGKFTAVDYAITVTTPVNGGLASDKATAKMGETVTLTLTPATGYKLNAITISKAGGGTVTVTGTGNTRTFVMPADAVTASATFALIDYKVTIDSGMVNGAVTRDKATANMGEIVTLTVTPAAGYKLETLTVEKVGGGTVTVTNGKFTMPTDDVIVRATYELVDYNVEIDTTITNGTVTVDKSIANMGNKIKLQIKGAIGYELDEVTVKGNTSNSTITVSKADYSFVMPAENVTVSATFKKSSYKVSVAPVANGVITLSTYSASYGDVISFTITPDAGYEMDTVIVTTDDRMRAVIPLTGNSFVMPAGNVMITASFKQKIVVVAPATPNTGVTGSMLPWIGVMAVAAGASTLLRKKKEEE